MTIQRPRLLHIDPDPTSRRLVADALRGEFFVSEASTGIDGYARCLRIRPDLILLEMDMEPWDGIKTLEMFRDNPKFTPVTFVVHTANARRRCVIRATELQAINYILKPCSPEELRYRMTSVAGDHLV